jgi:1,4-dihydroxy-6-naphthoate synthase
MIFIRLGHSPDPDDAFLFYGLTCGKVPLPGVKVIHCLEEIESLNRKALQGALEMTAISLHAYAYCADRYLLLKTGASVGEGYGPIVVARDRVDLSQLREGPVALPGDLTTAALLVKMALGPVRTATIPFDRILPAVQKGDVLAGVVIHEGQITYLDDGLHKILDLGQWWYGQTGLPLPLGVNVVRRDLAKAILAMLSQGLDASLRYALANRQEALQYAKQYARGLDERKTDRFVAMYVNRWSIDCRPTALEAMQRLLDMAFQSELIPRPVKIEMVEDGS